MRNVRKMLASLLGVICMVCVCGCGGGSNSEGIRGTIQVTGGYTISEFDMEIWEAGKEVTDKTVQCGKDYILEFDFDFKNLEEIAGNSWISTILQVQLGIFDNDANLELYDYGVSSQERGSFHRVEDGLWEVDFDFSSDSLPDFSGCYFILTVDSLEDENVNLGDVIAFSFSSENYLFKINGLNEMQIPLNVEKGTFDFTEENNVAMGHIVVKVPENCKKISVMIYDDAECQKRLATQTYDEEMFYGDALIVSIEEETLEKIRQAKTTKEEAEGKTTVYLKIVAEGGDSYQSAVVNTEFVIE